MFATRNIFLGLTSLTSTVVVVVRILVSCLYVIIDKLRTFVVVPGTGGMMLLYVSYLVWWRSSLDMCTSIAFYC